MVSPEGIVPVQAGPKGEAGVPRFFVVSRIFASWNQLDGWLRQVERLRLVA